jgi:hypothetical protein
LSAGLRSHRRFGAAIAAEGDFASLEEARPIALADGNTPAIMAHSIIIESLDDASLSEQWIRDRDGWKSTDA